MDCNDARRDPCTIDAFGRNSYFYGKLLDEHHFRMEQQYMNGKRWLLNRLGVGMGVLCGLDVRLSEEGAKLIVQPGVAIDACGREIIVPAAYCLDNPRQPTDALGSPEGEPIEPGGTLTLCLAYHECEADPIPVMACGCDVERESMPSSVYERFRLLVRPGLPARHPGEISAEQCRQIFPIDPPEAFDRRRAACRTLSKPCTDPKDTCVVLATVTLPESKDRPASVDLCTYRSVIYSNAVLLDLILCLARRVDACCDEESPSTKEAVVVQKVGFVDPNGDPAGRLDDPGEVPIFEVSPGVAQIRVTFDRPVDVATITAGGAGSDPETFSFLVVAEEDRRFVPGAVVAESDRSVHFTLEASSAGKAFRPGGYQVTLFAEVDRARRRPAITGANGVRLDGEPAQLPSGDGTEGGNFTFRFQIGV